VQSQAVMLATNHVFLGISALMTISVAAIWFIPKPKGPVAGAFATSLTTTAWSNSTTTARTAMVDNLHNADQAVTQMTNAGLSRMQALGSLEGTVQSQAVMLATNHVFLGISALMTISVAAIWFIPKPKGPVAGAANAH
jgi:hypothetical protein